MAYGRYQFYVQDALGNIVPGASVEVRKESDGLLASLYTDNTATTPLGNPIYSDADGFVYFHAASGDYKITVTKGSLTQIWRYVRVGGGLGDITAPVVTVDGEIALFSGTTGQAIKRASTTGILKAAAGVLAAAVAGTDYLAPPSGAAILKANSGGALANATAGTDYMKPDTTSAISVGFTLSPANGGTVSSGTIAPAPASGNYQFYTNNGAHTFSAPSTDCAITVRITNGASAGAITFSGFTNKASPGDALTTTNGNKFEVQVTRINGVSTYSILALQ